MDLRPFVRNEADVEEARRLICSGSFTYQPFIITDQLEVGAGYTFVTRNPHAGQIRWPGYDAAKYPSASLPRLLIAEEEARAFSQANSAIRQVYDGFVDQLCDQIHDIGKKSLADIGCFAGYIPVAMSKRGVRLAVGYDQDDRGACVNFLNRVLGTSAKFVHAGYDLRLGAISKCPAYDVVVSMSVLQHMTEPLRHLHFLRSITREALLLITNVWDDDDYVIRMGEPNQVFSNPFPWCFDNSVYLSEKLLRRCLKEAGFARVVDLETRFPSSGYHAEAPGRHDYESPSQAQPKPTGPSMKSFVGLAFCQG